MISIDPNCGIAEFFIKSRFLENFRDIVSHTVCNSKCKSVNCHLRDTALHQVDIYSGTQWWLNTRQIRLKSPNKLEYNVRNYFPCSLPNSFAAMIL